MFFVCFRRDCVYITCYCISHGSDWSSGIMTCHFVFLIFFYSDKTSLWPFYLRQILKTVTTKKSFWKLFLKPGYVQNVSRIFCIASYSMFLHILFLKFVSLLQRVHAKGWDLELTFSWTVFFFCCMAAKVQDYNRLVVDFVVENRFLFTWSRKTQMYMFIPDRKIWCTMFFGNTKSE